MKLAVSNIAWNPEEEERGYELLAALGVRLLEVAPRRLWPSLQVSTAADVASALTPVKRAGLDVVAFQAILFGEPDLTIFDSEEQRSACLEYLEKIAWLASEAKAKALVFGAPKNRRIPDGLSQTNVQEIARQFFGALGKCASQCGVYFCIEPNPAAYGANYLTHIDDAAQFVRDLQEPGIRLQLDTGELAINGVPIEESVEKHLDAVGHVHISQPHLDDFSAPWSGHEQLARVLHESHYTGVLSLEMKRSDRGLDAVREGIRFVQECYGAR